MNKIQVVISRSIPVAPDPRVERAAQALVAAGFGVTIVAWDRGWKLPVTEERDGFRLVRLRVPAAFGQGLRNLPGLARWQAALLVWLVRNQQTYGVIHACDLDTALPGLIAARAFRKRLVFDIFDSYAHAFRVGPLRGLVRWLESQVAARADAVIIADEIRWAQLGLARPRRLVVIYNSPPDLAAQLSAWSSEGTGPFRVAYVGLLDRTRGLEALLTVMGRRPEWRLDLAGFGVDADWVAARARSLPNVRFHGRVDYPEALRLMAAADALVATYDPAVPNHRYASPNKLFESMMLGKPIVVARGTHVDDLVEKHRCGLVVPYGDERALAAALDRLAADPGFRQALGQAGRQAYEAFYSWDRMRARLVNLYRDLASAEDEPPAGPHR
jgi:glycosyltransferase involved in cell wall biosynthesis